VLGIVLGIAVIVTGCGSGSSPTSHGPLPRPGALRELGMREAVSELKLEGASAAEIACVKANFMAMSEEQMAQRLVEGAPAEVVEAQSEIERLGPLGKGCR
jgi:hypothetical protein